MLPTLEGVIRRRVLLNFRVEPSLIQPLLPPPLEVLTQCGFAIAGVCLIGMEQLRPKGFPSAIGLSSENMAHRVAIRYPSSQGMQDGVFIWRRETDQCLVSLLGGRLFPGVHHRAAFTVRESTEDLSVQVTTENGDADVDLNASYTTKWQETSVFPSFEYAADFFRRGDCGFSCALRAGRLDGMRLKTLRWEMAPIQVTHLRAAFFQNGRFPSEAIQFDCALLMRGIPHEWHEMSDMPEFATALELD